MAFSSTFSIAGSTGRTGWYGGLTPVKFSQIFSGIPQQYAGSLVQVQEIVTIYTSVTDSKLVDVDLNWFDSKKYLGTYQLIDRDSVSPHGDGDDGFLVSEIQRIKRYSWYTVTANPAIPFAQGDGVVLNDCNFYLVPDVYLFPGTVNPVPGQRIRKPLDNHPALQGSTVTARADLEDADFNSKIAGLGLFLRPGVEGVSIKREIAVINEIRSLNPAVGVGVCDLGVPSCQQQFNAFIVQHNSTATASSQWYTSLPSCQIGLVSPNTCLKRTYTCPTDSSVKFDYWVRGGLV